MKVRIFSLLTVALYLFAGCSADLQPPSETVLVDGVNWAVDEQVAAGTHSTGINTRYVPISPGKCESVQVLNHYTRTLNGDETYHFYELTGKFRREERTYQIGFVKPELRNRKKSRFVERVFGIGIDA